MERKLGMLTKKETFGGDRCVYGIDCGYGFMDVYVPPKSATCIH